MWRSLGWLFVHGWSPADMNKLYLSGLVPTRDVQFVGGLRREVWIEESIDLTELRKATSFVTNAMAKATYRRASERLPAAPIQVEDADE